MQDLDETDGIWHFGGAPDEFPGKLRVEDGAPLLSLDRTAWEVLIGPGPALLDDELFARQLPLITGSCPKLPFAAGRQVALFGCRLAAVSTDEIRVRADAATFGYAVPAADAFTELALEFDWLRAWIAPTSLVEATWEPRDEPLTVDVAEKVVCETGVEGATIALVVNNPYRTSPYSITVSRQVHLRITLDQPITWRACLDTWVRIFQDFLVLATGKPVQLTSAHVRPHVPDDHGRVELVARVTRRLPEPDATPAKLYAQSSPVLLPGSRYLEQFSSLTSNWLKAMDEYGDAVGRLTAPANARFMYIDNRSAFVVQALEAFHHQAFSKAEKRDLPTGGHRKRVERILTALANAQDPLPAADIDWARRILSSRNVKSWTQMVDDVLNRTGALGELIKRTLPTFARDAEAIRHGVSHGVEAKSQGESAASDAERVRARDLRLARLHFITELLEWTLRVAILKEAGCNSSDDAARNANVRFALDQLEETQPSG